MDAGQSWRLLPRAGVWFRGLTFQDERTGFLVGNAGALLRTGDGGESFTALPSGTGESLVGIAFGNAHRGVAVGAAGAIVRTEDGGATWKPVASGTDDDLNGLAFRDPLFAVAVGRRSTVVVSKDAGATWKEAAIPVHEKRLFGLSMGGGGADIDSVEFLDAKTALISGDRALLRSEDGGVSWHAAPGSWYARDAAFGAGGVGVLATFEGIQRTEDGGRSWTLVRDVPARAAAYGGGETFVVVGTSGRILRSVDAGRSWASISGPDPDLRGAAFADVSTGWAVGSRGTVLHTTDGGTAWSVQRSLEGPAGAPRPDDALLAVAALDTRTAVAGGGGTLLSTTDGGAHWRTRGTGAQQALHAMVFAGREAARLFGSDGAILRMAPPLPTVLPKTADAGASP